MAGGAASADRAGTIGGWAVHMGDDARFHHREQVVRRTGTALVVTVLALSLLGMVGGSGWVSSTTTADSGRGIMVAHNRFLHRDAATELRVTVAGRLVDAGSIDLALARQWVERVDVRGVTPQPFAQIQAADGLVWRLPTRPGAALTVTVRYRPDDVGPLHGWARVAGATASFDQFVYP